MSKSFPFNMEKFCFSCGSDKISNKSGKTEKYCKKCGTVLENFSLEL